jgi:hypothetical protein
VAVQVLPPPVPIDDALAMRGEMGKAKQSSCPLAGGDMGHGREKAVGEGGGLSH